MRRIQLAILLALALPAIARGAEPAYDTLVICPQPLHAALRPWLEYRMAQGRKIGVLSDCDSPGRIRAGIRAVAAGGKLTHVLIVGDDHPDRQTDDKLRAITVPAAKIDAKVNVRWGSEPQIATDNWYADVDDDQTPDVAIGRLTADTPQDLAVMVKKIIDYEQSTDNSMWRRRVNFIAGVGGFGVVADTILDMATKRFITGEIPAGYQTSMTYASLNSPYCPDPRRLSATAVARCNEGCLFWVYIGHGQRRWLDWMRVGRRAYPILNVDDVADMHSAAGAPIAVLLACYAGAFDGREDCLSEAMLAAPRGPVAVISGTRVTMPYANAVLAHALLQQCFAHDHATLGGLLLYAKREAAGGPDGEGTRQLLDALAAAISPNKDQLDAERREHLNMYNLLGDPLLALHKPRPVKVAVEKTATAGEQLEVAGVTPIAGRVTIELVCRRDKLTFAAPSRRNFELTDETLGQLAATYTHANDQRWTTQTIDSAGGEFAAKIAVPEKCHGHCHVRVYVEGRRDCALGAADVYVHQRDVEDNENEADAPAE